MLLFYLLLLGCLTDGTRAFTKEEWYSELQDIFRRYGTDVETQNFDATSDFYTESAVVLPPGHHAIRGKEDFPEYLRQRGESEDNLKVIDIVAYALDFAVGWAQLTEKYEDGTVLQGKYVCLLKKVDGKALVQMEIWNYDS